MSHDDLIERRILPIRAGFRELSCKVDGIGRGLARVERNVSGIKELVIAAGAAVSFACVAALTLLH
jgi:hypothetical protein